MAGGGFSYSPVGQWSPNWDVHPAEFTGDPFPDLFLYNAETGVWFRVLNVGVNPQYVSGTWSPAWQVFPADVNADRLTDFLLYNGTWDPGWQLMATRSGGWLLYASPSGVWVRAAPAGPGTFTYANGTFESGRSLVVTSPRVW